MNKIKQKFIVILITVIAVFLLTGCFNNNKAAEELMEYHNNDWLTYLSIKKEKISPLANDMIDFVSEDNDQGIEELTKEGILPAMEELIDYLEDIEIENKQLKQLHQSLIDMEKEHYNSYRNMVEVLDKGNKAEIEEMYNTFPQNTEKYRENADHFAEEREKLMDKYNVEFIEDEDGQTIMAKK